MSKAMVLSWRHWWAWVAVPTSPPAGPLKKTVLGLVLLASEVTTGTGHDLERLLPESVLNASKVLSHHGSQVSVYDTGLGSW